MSFAEVKVPVRTHQDAMVTIAIEMLDLESKGVIGVVFCSPFLTAKPNLCQSDDGK